MIPVATLDAAMLLAESEEMPLHNVGVMIFEVSNALRVAPYEAMRSVIGSRVHRIPAFCRKLVSNRFGIGDLHWIDDANFDIDRHLVRASLPSPGGDAELRAFVGAYAAKLLARDRPLWEIVLVEGLANGQVAALAKIHHATMDGAALSVLVGELLDHDASVTCEPAARVHRRRLERDPGVLTRAYVAARTLAQKPKKIADAVADVAGAAARTYAARTTPTTAPPESFRIPPTPWEGALTVRRTAAFADVGLGDVRTIATAFGATINDVVLAACAASLRSWLAARGALPSRSLIANVPVALSHSAHDGVGNHVSILRVHLPMGALEPGARLAQIKTETARGKQEHQASGANTYRRLTDLVLGLTVPAFVSSVVGLYARHRGADFHPALWNVVISNVPGPREPLYCGGARLACIYPLGPVQHGSGLNLTVMSTGDRLGLGVLACADRVPDVHEIARGFVDEISALLSVARARQAPST